MSTAPTHSNILHLYRQYVRSCKQFKNYNFREYFTRRSRYTFRQLRDTSDADKKEKLYEQAKQDLGVLQRQAIISQIYIFDKLVLETLYDKKCSKE